ncbi:MAG TPA: class I SAM-dependent methyltransferase [Burkholderiales bacterium]|nr:class I SAM-dependent methyltransferase [Burkholderiales bacterium]
MKIDPQPAFEKRWRRRFEEYALRFDDDAGIAGWSPSGLDARLRHFAQAWSGAISNAQWLDVGCGAGSYTRYLMASGVKVLGLDYSYPSLKKARGRKGGEGATWAVGDATRLPVASKSFDGALCFGVLQALSRPDDALRELHDCLKDGGELWVDALNAYCLPTLIQRLRARMRGLPMHLRYDSPWQLARSMRNTGLSEVKLHWVPIVPMRLAKFQPLFESAPLRVLIKFIPFLGALISHAFVLSGRRRG